MQGAELVLTMLHGGRNTLKYLLLNTAA